RGHDHHHAQPSPAAHRRASCEIGVTPVLPAMIRSRVGVATRLRSGITCPPGRVRELSRGKEAVADKLTQQITDALSKAAADPGGPPLSAGKTDPGLFPSAAAAKPAAQKALADGLVRVARTETKGRTTRELYELTEKGWEFLLAAVNPKQVL